MRPAALALAACAAALAACTPPESASCPGAPVADLQLEGPLVPAGDPRVAALDPVPELPDCTPDPADEEAPIRYPAVLDPFDARLSSGPDGDAAALCRPNGSVLSGTHAGASYAVEASADSAFLCESECAATLRVFVRGDLAVEAGGAPASFTGILVEALAEARGSCDGCLPLVPGADPARRACAARYALTDAPR